MTDILGVIVGKTFESWDKMSKEKAEACAQKTESYQCMMTCMLNCSNRLASHLKQIVDVGESSLLGTEKSKIDRKFEDNHLYSAYLLARFFATTVLFKKQELALDIGLPIANHIFANILDRIEFVLSAPDPMIEALQVTERFFNPNESEKPILGGPLQVTVCAQRTVGELMFRSFWESAKLLFNDGPQESAQNTPTSPCSPFAKAATEITKKAGTWDLVPINLNLSDESMLVNSILNFVEFQKLVECQSTMEQWIIPLKRIFEEIERQQKMATDELGHKRAVGSRLFFFQNALIDIVDFLEPAPRTRHVALYSRQRLRIGKRRYVTEAPHPRFLDVTYQALSDLRDGQGSSAILKTHERLRTMKLHVFVKAANRSEEERTNPGFWNPGRMRIGDDPHSQRVLLTLNELNIDHDLTHIPMGEKPAFAYLICGRHTTPFMVHEGYILTDSREIIRYIKKKFGKEFTRPRGYSENPIYDAHFLRISGPERLILFHSIYLEIRVLERWRKQSESQGNGNLKNFEAMLNELKMELGNELSSLDKLLKEVRNVESKHAVAFGGEKLGEEDLVLAPFLNNVFIASNGFQELGCSPWKYEHIKQYLEAVNAIDAFKKTRADEKDIVTGYGRVAEGKGEWHSPKAVLELQH